MEIYNKIIRKLMSKGVFNFLPDDKYLKLEYKARCNKKLSLKNPVTFTEKLQWLKLNDRNDLYTTMVDKYEAKKYVKEKIKDDKLHIIDTLGIYNSFDEINFNDLPNQFVIKCTHDSGGVVIVNDKKNININEIRNKITRCLNRNYYYHGREWPYKNVKPRIIIEKFMVDESGTELKDYKFFCFNGKVKYIQVDFNRFKKHTKNIYNCDWEFQDVEINYPNDKNKIIEKPKKLNDMIKYAEILSKDTYFVRVDFYSIDNKIYFGEITFYPGSGFMPFKPEEWNKKFGDLIKLPNK